jgi:hypothetical protein
MIRCGDSGCGRGSPARLVLQLEPKEYRSDRQLVARLEAGFLDHLPVDADLIAASKVAHKDAVVGHRQTAMAPRNLGKVESDVALEVTANQKDRPEETDDRGRPFDQWDESE